MHGFKSTFRVTEADLNARRSDYSILEAHSISIGRVFPGLMDFVDQNISIRIDPINLSKSGSHSADGPVGRGHYYHQLEDFTITTYCANPLQAVRTDTFGDGFLFINRVKDAYGRRQVFFRSKFKSSTIIDNNINSFWLKQLATFSPDGLIDIDIKSSIDVHSYINQYSFLYGMVGDMVIYYSDLDENGNKVGFNAGGFSGNPIGSAGTEFDIISPDPRFDIPPGAESND